jgi:DNA-binding NarL/FixJ family response regulator
MSLLAPRRTVVIADDHPVVLAGLQSLIAMAPQFEVVAVAVDGADALEAMRGLRPDIAVLDIQMPRLTGLEVLQAAGHEGLASKIVFLTATVNDAHITDAMAAGAWGIVLKDTASDELLTCLETVAQGSRCIPHELVTAAFGRDRERRGEAERLNGLLTEREREIAVLVARGLGNKEIARLINVTEGTVKIHLHNVYQKLSVSNRTALATLAQRHWPKDPRSS